MDVEKLIEQLNARGLSNGSSLGYHCGLYDEAATALSALQAEYSRLRAELEYEREYANAYHEECSRWEAENEKLLAENIRWGQVASEKDKAIDNLSKELEWKDMVIELAQRKQQEAMAALRREQDG